MGCALLVAIASLSLSAQNTSKTELFVGYTHVRFNGQPLGFADATGLNGGEVSGSYVFRPWIGVVLDASAAFGSALGQSVHNYALLTGPQVWYGKGKARVFGRVLVGASHDTVSVLGSNNHLTYGAGGGAEIDVRPRLAVRLIQADYLMGRGFSETQRNLRLSGGVVFRW